MRISGRAAGAALLLLLPGCTSEEGGARDVPAPGTMKVLSIAPIVRAQSDENLIRNGDFSDFWAGAPGPTGFGFSAAAAISRLERAPAAGTGAREFRVKQIWDNSDARLTPRERFHTVAEQLEPNRRYCLSVTAEAERGTLAAIDIHDAAENGVRIAANAVRVLDTGEGPQEAEYCFTAPASGSVIVSAHGLPGMTIPSAVYWDAWKLSEAPVPEAEPTPEQLRYERAQDVLGKFAEANGGFAKWYSSTKPLFEGLRGRYEKFDDAGQQWFATSTGYVFPVDALRSTVHADLIHLKALDPRSGPSRAFTALMSLQRRLHAQGISLVVALVPDRLGFLASEVSETAPAGGVAPQRIEFARALLYAGVDVLDLDPAFQIARGAVPLYGRAELGLTGEGLRAAAVALAERLGQYGIPRTIESQAFRVEATARTENNAYAERLPEEERDRVAPEETALFPVLDLSNVPVGPAPAAPVLLAGSHAQAFVEEGAGMLAHLSLSLASPIALFPNSGDDTQLPGLLATGAAATEGVQVVALVVDSVFLRFSGEDAWVMPAE
jgi:hypothetical protein